MKRFNVMLLAVVMLSAMMSLQGFSQERSSGNEWMQARQIDLNQFPTNINTSQTSAGYRFAMSATNNSGKDITIEQAIFGQIFMYDDDGIQPNFHSLKGRNWDVIDSKVFANGQTITEVYELTNEQMRALDGRADGKYGFYAVPALIVNNVYNQLMMVYAEFEVSTGETPLPPAEEPNGESVTTEPTPSMSWDINQFESSVDMALTEDGYRFTMRLTNNSGGDIVVDKSPVFSDILLWDDAQVRWHTLRDPARGQQSTPKMVANGQTMEETFDLSIETLRALDGRADGKYRFVAVPHLVINNESTQLANAVKAFDVATGEDDLGDSGNGTTNQGDNPVTDGRPPVNEEVGDAAPPPDVKTDLDFLDFPTSVNAEKTEKGYRFVMRVSNNSGRDIMADNLPLFARMIVYDVQTGEWLYLREKSWEYKPALFASGTTMTETYDINNLPAGKYYFFAVPSIVVGNHYTQLQAISSEFELTGAKVSMNMSLNGAAPRIQDLFQ